MNKRSPLRTGSSVCLRHNESSFSFSSYWPRLVQRCPLLHLFGIDHERFTFKHQGLDARLTGVEAPARVVSEILA